MIDLHVHTTASDGTYCAQETAAFAKECGVHCVAITDHNVFLSQEKAVQLSKQYEITVVPGAEISTTFGQKEVHILAYGTLPAESPLTKELCEAAQRRRERAMKIAARLEGLGMPLSTEMLLACPGGVPGRVHIARQMVQNGYCKTTDEAFDRYLGVGKRAYVPCSYLSAAEAVQMIRKSHMTAVLAHPMRYHFEQPQLLQMIQALVSSGLQGVEVYYPSHNAGDVHFLKQCCKRFGLVAATGSDFHGKDHHWQRIGVPFTLTEEEKADIYTLLLVK